MKRIGPILFLTAMQAGACSLTWDEPDNAGWLEGIRFYRDGQQIGTADPRPPVDCATVAVIPCATCAYTAAFFRGDQEGPRSEPLGIEIDAPGAARIILTAH